ncbi:MAG TPA: hypothetical protein VMS64_10045 [Candidatus Methylomirabilis sp.]|nr:hypothetical protein [Candidatus Methylomirabilis sp.]
MRVLGATAFAVATVPVALLTTMVTEKFAPLAAPEVPLSTAVRVGGLCTVTVPVADPLVTVAPLLASVPFAVAARVNVPSVEDEHAVYWKVAVDPPEMACAAGVVQPLTAAGATPLAVAPPVFFTESVAVNAWPASAVDTLGTIDTALRAAAACTVMAAEVTVPVVTVAPLFASVPLAEVLRVRVPAVLAEQPV